MTSPTDAIRDLPPGRMHAVHQLETSLRGGATFAQAAARAKVSLSTAKIWAARFALRKQDLARETPDARLARYVALALALKAEGRIDEAGLYEAGARKLETLLARLDQRLAEAPEAQSDPYAPARAFLARAAECLEGRAGPSGAWAAVAAYYRVLREVGADISREGRVTWPSGQVPDGVPSCPAWLPCDPWAITDEALWEREAGAAIRLL